MNTASRPALLLLSSNTRRRYAEDVLTVLAAPPGGIVQFRYGTDYVSATLQQKVADKTVVGVRALIGFAAEIETKDPFLLPVRFAEVTAATCVGDMFIFKLRVLEYANLEDFPFTDEAIREKSVGFLGKLVMNNSRYFPAVVRFPDFDVSTPGDAAQLWLGVARRLALHATFRSCYFIRVEEPLHKTSQRSMPLTLDGNLKIDDHKSLRLPVSFFSEEYSEDRYCTLTCVTDGRFLRVLSDDTYDVALRYDSVEFWLQPHSLSADAMGHLTVRLAVGDDSQATDRVLTAVTRFPVLIRRSRPRLVARVLLTSLGAMLVALPAILGQTSSLALRALLAVIGAVIISYSTVVMSKGDK